MKILIAPDSFKDALSAVEVARAIEKGILLANPNHETKIFPMADGGEGSAEILGHHFQSEKIVLEVEDALGRPVAATYFYSGQTRTAFIEMAEASGLQKIIASERNCMKASTYGTGQMIAHAVGLGAKKIVLAIGGSATNDAGMGMANALGFRFFDEQNRQLKGSGEALLRVHHMDDKKRILPSDVQVDVICDVDNPLYGEKGAAYVYARQKGADDDEIKQLDAGLMNMAKLMNDFGKKDVANIPGAGAAGGLGAGCLVFLNAKLHKGIELFMEKVDFDRQLKNVDLLITGEGKIDGQTLHGKLIQGITSHASHYHVPVVALCGMLELEPEQVDALGLKAAFSIQSKPASLEEAIRNTEDQLTKLSFNLFRMINV